MFIFLILVLREIEMKTFVRTLTIAPTVPNWKVGPESNSNGRVKRNGKAQKGPEGGPDSGISPNPGMGRTV